MNASSPRRFDAVLIKLESETTSTRIAPPFGILYLAGALEKAGFSVKLIHRSGTPAALTETIRDVLEAGPLVIGFSVLSGPSIVPALKASTRLRKSTAVPIVWGGMHPTMCPGQTLDEPSIDYVVMGEGEETLVDLVRALASGVVDSAAPGIQGLAFKTGGAKRINSGRPFIKDLDACKPAWHLLPIGNYLYRSRFFLSEFGSALPGLIAPYISSRGCPWRCGYCYNQFVNKRSFRAHSAGRVVRDIESLKRDHGVTAVVFEDDNLFTDRNRALEIVRGIGLPWSASLRADDFRRWGDGFVRELRAAGCVELRIGAESGVPRVLDLMAKDISVEDIRLSADICRRHGINALYNFMAGIPDETWSEVLQTLDLMDELDRGGGGVVVNGPSVFFPWPGTPLYDRAVALGFRAPRALMGWKAGWGSREGLVPGADTRVRHLAYFRTLALAKDRSGIQASALGRPFARLARLRWRKRLFRFPLDRWLPRAVGRALKAAGLMKRSDNLSGE